MSDEAARFQPCIVFGRRYERAEKALGDYEADIFRHLDAAEDVMAENSSKAVKCGISS